MPNLQRATLSSNAAPIKSRGQRPRLRQHECPEVQQYPFYILTLEIPKPFLHTSLQSRRICRKDARPENKLNSSYLRPQTESGQYKSRGRKIPTRPDCCGALYYSCVEVPKFGQETFPIVIPKCHRRDSNPQARRARDFKSLAFANFATVADLRPNAELLRHLCWI